MVRRMQNKIVVVGLAMVASVLLIATALLLNWLVPGGTIFAFVIRSAPLVVLIPCLLLAFNAACDWFDQTDVTRNATHTSDVDSRESVTTGSKHRSSRSRSRQTVVPVSVHERTFRSVPAGNKWWVGQ